MDVEGKLGSERDIGETGVFVPVTCSEDRLLFTDLRFRLDNQDNNEANIGLGIRQLKETGVLGTYAYFDRRKSGETDKYHSQTTLGAEWLTENWEVRGNAYIPLTGEKTIGQQGGTSTPFLQGSGIFVRETATDIIKEEGMYGGDIEAGFKIPDTRFWLHAGMFSFNGEDAPSLEGGRVRASFQLTENITLLAEGQYDDERGRQGWVGARLSIPFGGPAQKPQGLKARMTASPVRDVDIVTSTKREKKGVNRTYEAINSESGTAQRVVYVDNSNTDIGGGTGTKENPFTTLAAAEAAMQDYDIVYIASGTGTSTGMDNGFAIARNNVQVIGSGSSFIYDGSRLTSGSNAPNPNGFTLIAAGAKPIMTNSAITNLSGDGIYITGANTSLAGFDVIGARRHGIYADADGVDLGNLSITNVTANNNLNAGIRARTNGAAGRYNSVTLTDTIADNNSAQGIYVEQRNASAIGDVTLTRTQTNNNNNRGTYILADLNSTLDTLTINTATANDNKTGSGTGILIELFNGGKIMQANASNLTTTGNMGSGLSVSAFSSVLANISTLNSFTLNGITATGNSTNGVNISSSTYALLGDINLNNVNASNNIGSSDGLRIGASGTSGSITSVKINNATLENNIRGGLVVTSAGNGAINNLEMTHSSVTDNQRDGIQLNKDGTGVFNIDLSGNNSLFGNGISDTVLYRDLKLDLDNGSVNAQYNWWGQSGGPLGSQIIDEGACPSCGTADTTNALNSNPN